jgi:hypothetical protein
VLFDDIERRTFDFFWANGNPANGMVPDRYPSSSPASIAAIGMALTAYVIGARPGFITREQARTRTLATVRFFRNAPQGSQRLGMTGYKGFFYHFLDMKTGHRAGRSELSTVDTALLIGGMLHAQAYFDGEHPDEAEIRAQVDAIYWRIDWKWAQVRGDLRQHGLETGVGFHPARLAGLQRGDARGAARARFAQPPLSAQEAWKAWTNSFKGAWGRFMGYEHLSFAPLFGHQYSHMWIDFRGIQGREHARARHRLFRELRAALPTRSGPTRSPIRRAGTSTGPMSGASPPATAPARIHLTDRTGRARYFLDYSARGAGRGSTRRRWDDRADRAISCLPFAPEIAIPATEEMHSRYGQYIYSKYGFLRFVQP